MTFGIRAGKSPGGVAWAFFIGTTVKVSCSAIYVLFSTSQNSYDMISIFNLSCSKEVREFEYSKRDMHASISNR
jgi:hypothetical protein